MASVISLTSLIVGAAVFVILFVVLSVPLWVSIIAGVAALLLWGVIGGSAGIATQRRGHASH